MQHGRLRSSTKRKADLLDKSGVISVGGSYANLPTIIRRPSQLTAARASKRPLSVEALLKHFTDDVSVGGLVSGGLPSRPAIPMLLRVAQWNVNNFSGCNVGGWPDPWQLIELALSLQADVIILNEFYAWDDESAVKAHLRAAGYELALSLTDFPTLLATRCECIGPARSLVFKHSAGALLRAAQSQSTCRLHRAACCRTLQLGGKTVEIYATHLNHIDGGGARREEASALLDDIANHEAEVPVLVIADFNQPRQRDYSSEEWLVLSRSAAERGEPENDGVAELFENHGFACSLDLSHACDRNWPSGTHPPPTHWTGTAIDYSFARGLRLCGTYVIPTTLSDHFPVVSDWTLHSF